MSDPPRTAISATSSRVYPAGHFSQAVAQALCLGGYRRAAVIRFRSILAVPFLGVSPSARAACGAVAEGGGRIRVRGEDRSERRDLGT